MIELIFSERCTGCTRCVTVCPSNVLALGDDGKPRIADQAACQTCFMCELYCHSDALYVHPDCEQAVSLDPARILASGLPGQYRRDSGWDEWAAEPRYTNQHWRMESIFALARELAPPSPSTDTGARHE
ncbi:4Fe-4S dicluster domain-containing protein [Pseudomonas japonica]|uniref:NAD-dependent dihydropyrimidine dehydrogenase, PreA subunit n=1 Tax=Pseudomonas japonica TaxID=256466 RepID=A0A239L4X2_9PSED|nr:ferredoxin family protein [Pseudomonas japonica]SNT24594.1 NAD-dependent dihydropyrimidine dehydrogenase, PreA subunit [Pseudomonas japonica]